MFPTLVAIAGPGIASVPSSEHAPELDRHLATALADRRRATRNGRRTRWLRPALPGANPLGRPTTASTTR
jgi:hypothetical protein